MCAMQRGDERIYQLVAETCRHPQGSLKWQQGLTKLISLIEESKQLWQENTPYYEDAMQQTWIFLCQNLCQAGTGKQYDPNQSSVITWLNNYLKWRLQDFYQANQIQKSRINKVQQLESGKIIDSLENVAAPSDILPMLETVRNWAETDASGELGSLHIRGHPEVTGQVLILRRLPPETPWKDLSAEWGLPISTLSQFYQRKCLPLLRKFGESEGYL